MSFITWTEQYATSVPEMDEHHQHLFSLLNELHEKVLACQTLEEEQELARVLLAELAEYASYHFVAEERLMQECGFPGREAHCREHNLFRERVAAMTETFATNSVAMSFDTFRLLYDWIAEHVLVRDAEYVPYVGK
ncbi:MAG: hemerythrin-like metal-binding protein [Anaerosporomusa subterranea]|jgi:hemerythrin-like metal-binding protein|nr:hemerythrin-like metal-binding protein [Anaerosporomusa subterranea]